MPRWGAEAVRYSNLSLFISFVLHGFVFGILTWASYLIPGSLELHKPKLSRASMAIEMRTFESARPKSPLGSAPRVAEKAGKSVSSAQQRERVAPASRLEKIPEVQGNQVNSRYADLLLPNSAIVETQPAGHTGGEREDDFSFDVRGKGLSPENEKKVSILVDSVQLPLALRKVFKDPMSCQLHLQLKGGYLHLHYLTGSPYLRAEIFKQLEAGKAVKSFGQIMQGLGREELFITLNLRSVGSLSESDTEYRTHLDGDRLRISMTQIHRIDSLGNLPDKFARRQDELSAFYGRELTNSMAFNRVVRGRRYLLE